MATHSRILAWRAAVQRVTKSWTWVKQLSMQADRYFGKGREVFPGWEPSCFLANFFAWFEGTRLNLHAGFPQSTNWSSIHVTRKAGIVKLSETPPNPALPSSRGWELWTEVWDKNAVLAFFRNRAKCLPPENITVRPFICSKSTCAQWIASPYRTWSNITDLDSR